LGDKGFAKRLNTACDGHPHIPPYGHGRQTWIKEKLDVSHEAVRKWFTGESRPRPSKMKDLSRTLEVDEAWLALGIAPDMQPHERRARNVAAEGAVHTTMGLVQMNGGHCAFPDDRDPRAAFVDFYAIIRGQQMAFHISLAQQISEGQYKFIIPREFDQCTIIGLIHVFPLRVHAIRMNFDLIERHKVRRGGYFEVTVSKRDSEYFTGSDSWPRMHNLNNF
jgi:hypothetical protein